MNFKSLINDICCDGRIKDGIFDFRNQEHVFVLQEYLEKAGCDVNYVVEKTANLFEAGRFPERQAYNKDGILVTFPSKEYKDRAVNKGTHFAENPKKSDANIFKTPPPDVKAGGNEDSIYNADVEKPKDVSIDQELSDKNVDTQKDDRTPNEKQVDSKGVEAILIGQTPLVNYSVDEAKKYGFYNKGFNWYNTEGEFIGEQAFDEKLGVVISINESLLSRISSFFKNTWGKVNSYFKNIVNRLITNGMSDLSAGEETYITIPASINKDNSGLESPTAVNEGAIEAIRGNYNEALTVKYVIEKNDAPIDIVLTENLDENYVVKVVQLDTDGRRYIPEVENVVKDWDKKLRAAAGSKYEEIRSVISLASNDM